MSAGDVWLLLAAGIAGMVLSAIVVSPGVDPGANLLLGPVAAVVLGGAALSGGLASPASTWGAAFFVTVLNQMLRDQAIGSMATRPRVPRLDRRSFPELHQQALVANKGTKHVQREPHLQRPYRLARRSLCCLAEDLKRQVDECVPVRLLPSPMRSSTS